METITIGDGVAMKPPHYTGIALFPHLDAIAYYCDGRPHRENGPAVVYGPKSPSGPAIQYWIRGVLYTKEDYFKLYPPKTSEELREELNQLAKDLMGDW